MKAERLDHYLGLDHKENIYSAAEKLKGVLKATPLTFSDFFSNEYGCKVYIKPENLQVTGSYKIRGAYNKISGLPDSGRGVIASSAGNHAQGVAYSAQIVKVPATIVMPSTTPLLKVSATKSYGADVILYGDVYDDAYNKAMSLAEERGLEFVHPFDDYEIICGQGTVGLEIIEELADVDEIIVPIGGGGLIAGTALIAKALKPSIKVIGAVPVGAMSMKISLEEGRVTRLASVKTSAEGV
ncbi:MAG: pyridoxal-phosphate dependent enzyme, partial [Clostridiales Family XIII bacterium]|nr:pyridoxal-phosphate dependent enzyme [Clostridiales Family XIII bacterium]